MADFLTETEVLNNYRTVIERAKTPDRKARLSAELVQGWRAQQRNARLDTVQEWVAAKKVAVMFHYRDSEHRVAIGPMRIVERVKDDWGSSFPSEIMFTYIALAVEAGVYKQTGEPLEVRID